MFTLYSASVAGQEYRSNSPVTETAEQEALKVLDDSDWAHTVKPSLQDTPCTYRMVANQRVFETTFYINASDVLDGSEKTLYLPSVFTDPKEIPQHQSIAESKF